MHKFNFHHLANIYHPLAYLSAHNSLLEVSLFIHRSTVSGNPLFFLIYFVNSRTISNTWRLLLRRQRDGRSKKWGRGRQSHNRIMDNLWVRGLWLPVGYKSMLLFDSKISTTVYGLREWSNKWQVIHLSASWIDYYIQLVQRRTSFWTSTVLPSRFWYSLMCR